MYFIPILLGCLALVSAGKQEFKLPQEKLQKIQKVGTECATENKLDSAVFAKIPDGSVPRDDIHDKFIYCFGIKSGLSDQDGHIVVDKVAGLVGDHPLATELKNVILKCNEITKDNPAATVSEAYHCYIDNTPLLVVF